MLVQEEKTKPSVEANGCSCQKGFTDFIFLILFDCVRSLTFYQTGPEKKETSHALTRRSKPVFCTRRLRYSIQFDQYQKTAENQYVSWFALFLLLFPLLSSPLRYNGGPDMAVFLPMLANTRAPRRGLAPDRGLVGGPWGSENSPEHSGGMEPLMLSKSVKGTSITDALAAQSKGRGTHQILITP